MQIRGMKRALAWLVDHRLPGNRIKLIDDVVSLFAAHENAAHRPLGTDEGRTAARQLGGRPIGKIRPMPFAGMDHEHLLLARCLEHALGWFHRGEQQRGVVAELFPKTTGQNEVSLHIDDHERGRCYIELEWKRFGLDDIHVGLPRLGSYVAGWLQPLRLFAYDGLRTSPSRRIRTMVPRSNQGVSHQKAAPLDTANCRAPSSYSRSQR